MSCRTSSLRILKATTRTAHAASLLPLPLVGQEKRSVRLAALSCSVTRLRSSGVPTKVLSRAGYFGWTRLTFDRLAVTCLDSPPLLRLVNGALTPTLRMEVKSMSVIVLLEMQV